MTGPQKEKFLRNHQEDRGVMLASAAREERLGNVEIAARIRKVVADWDRIAEWARTGTLPPET
jgi:hypothetical protein